MISYAIQGQTLTDIAAAIRAKSGTQEQYRPDQMAAAIEAIPSGSTEMEDLLVERPGTFTEYTNDRVESVGNLVFYQSTLVAASFKNATSAGSGSFWQSSKLENIAFPELQEITLSNAFRSCSKLNNVVLPSIRTLSGSSTFMDCSALDTLVLPGEMVCQLTGASAFTGTPIESGTGYIYVPRALIDEYKTATNWALYAEQFRVIEDYPEIQALVEEMMAA